MRRHQKKPLFADEMSDPDLDCASSVALRTRGMHSSSLDGILKWKKPWVDTLFPLDDQQRVLKGVEEVEMDARGG